nr:class D beta-lactamase [Candidatus Magnetaquicoccus inordinatus]
MSLFLLFSWPLQGGEHGEDLSALENIFSAFSATGTMQINDLRPNRQSEWIHDRQRASTRFSPASTYKIPHTLFALQAGIIDNEFQIFTWDGVARDFPGWNQNQTLLSSLRYSVVWVYQQIARQLGKERTKEYLQAIAYGNADPDPNQESYWLEGNLAISASEQIHFLQRLYYNDLPFALAHQRLVKDLLLLEAGKEWRLRGKTGWSGTIGWWVGWVERLDGPIFFALNIDTPQRLADLPKREALGRRVLCLLQALPAAACPPAMEK